MSSNKGAIRNEKGYRQKFTGSKWIRLCNDDACESYARINGFCRAHYSLPEHSHYEKGATRVNPKGKRQRFNGKEWVLLCRVDGCVKLAALGSVCSRHTAHQVGIAS